ncbi:MAG: D-alanyl-D-alanine carboxypeptidase family protein, partial [Gemmatimonadota bacterium]
MNRQHFPGSGDTQHNQHGAGARGTNPGRLRPAGRPRLTAARRASFLSVVSLASALATSAAALPAVHHGPGAVQHGPMAVRHGARAGHPAGAAVIGGPQLARRGVVVNYPAHGHLPRLPWVPASAYVVADAGTGQVLGAKNPHGRFLPASTLKVLTAVSLMPVLGPGQLVRASAWAAATEPSKVGLIAGRWYRVGDLFRALLMISANDAAVSLAQATGSYRKGMAIINAEARHLQADDTVAKRPNGLDARGQHVSAYDEALWARAALALPEFMRDEALRTCRFPLRRRHSITLYTQNTMLDTFPGDLGGKIGWTTAAGATFIGWARRHHRTLVVTILHATPLTELQTAATLLSWGFSVDGKINPVGTLVSPLPVATARPRHPARHQPAR